MCTNGRVLRRFDKQTRKVQPVRVPCGHWNCRSCGPKKATAEARELAQDLATDGRTWWAYSAPTAEARSNIVEYATKKGHPAFSLAQVGHYVIITTQLRTTDDTRFEIWAAGARQDDGMIEHLLRSRPGDVRSEERSEANLPNRLGMNKYARALRERRQTEAARRADPADLARREAYMDRVRLEREQAERDARYEYRVPSPGFLALERVVLKTAPRLLLHDGAFGVADGYLLPTVQDVGPVLAREFAAAWRECVQETDPQVLLRAAGRGHDWAGAWIPDGVLDAAIRLGHAAS